MEKRKIVFRQLLLLPTNKTGQIDEHIKFSKNLFKRFQFSKYGIPPGTTQKILSDPDRYWRRIEKDGKVFYEPLRELKKIHERFTLYFSRRLRLVDAATAYWGSSSIVKNGNVHRHNRSALCLDMRHAFESVKTKHLYRFLFRSAFCFSQDEAWIISRLLTYRGRLRKGSSVSPFLFNLLCERMDEAIPKAIKIFPGMVHSHYGDDIGISSPEEIFPERAEQVVRSVLSELHIYLNEKKTKRFSHGIMEFPGVVIINGCVRPQGKYIAKVLQSFEGMSPEERRGHCDFINQFKYPLHFHPSKRIPKSLKKFFDL